MSYAQDFIILFDSQAKKCNLKYEVDTNIAGKCLCTLSHQV
jgi:hypothetical protein